MYFNLSVHGSVSDRQFLLRMQHRRFTYFGASKFKWNFQNNSKRRIRHLNGNEQTNDLLFHYPDVSKQTGEQINWRKFDPSDLYEPVRQYGSNTIELLNLPMGKTPEYLQERLRRFFSKFGVVINCRCLNHELDPYQSKGIGFVTLNSADAVARALKAPLRFPGTLHYKTIHMRHVETNITNDAQLFHKTQHCNTQILSILGQLYRKVEMCKSVPLETIWDGIFERQFTGRQASNSRAIKKSDVVDKNKTRTDKLCIRMNQSRIQALCGNHSTDGAVRTADHSVYRIFGTWQEMLSTEPFNNLFVLTDIHGEPVTPGTRNSDMRVSVRLISEEELSKAIYSCGIQLSKKLNARFSTDWREGKPTLPSSVEDSINFWDHKPPLSEKLQIFSRATGFYKMFDERYMLKLRHKIQRNRRRRLIRQTKQLEGSPET